EVVGASPPLVIHHFGSKAGLVAECDRYVRDVLEEATSGIVEGEVDASVQTMLATPDLGRAIDYVSRSLRDGGPVGHWWFDQLLDLGAGADRRLVLAGSARELPDEEMGVLLMMAMELGMLMLRPLVEARLGKSLTSPETLERWARAEVDLLTNGYVLDNPAARDAAARTEE
ncbi:hypothetical protein, partial [Ilumatobacter sp.]|uniref:hypothetical protein n=1 Tax=Ilumatobacter sp. TaxID=1967498 RepID=UPI003C45B9E6